MSWVRATALRTKVVRGASPVPRLKAPVVATLGNLDGVHRGHQALLDRVQRAKGGGSSVVVSFYPHPGKVLGTSGDVPLLTPLRERMEVLSAYDVDFFFLIHFTRGFSRVRAADFLERWLIGRLGVEHLFIGPDAHVGADREGDPEFIRRFMEGRGRAVTVVPFVEEGGERISSRRIRRIVGEGDIEAAQALLGRPYRVVGTVIGGDRRGRTIGFPTANMAPGKHVVPAHGVYAAWAHLAGQRYRAVVNIGVRPTFGGRAPTLETHLLDYGGGDFYGARLGVDFVARLRPELKFPSVETLSAQIRADVALARTRLVVRPRGLFSPEE